MNAKTQAQVDAEYDAMVARERAEMKREYAEAAKAAAEAERKAAEAERAELENALWAKYGPRR